MRAASNVTRAAPQGSIVLGPFPADGSKFMLRTSLNTMSIEKLFLSTLL